jgi:oligosaccharyltransferase complex subunit alpha (ribophorin I)
MSFHCFLLLLLPLLVLSNVHINNDITLTSVSRQVKISSHIEEQVVQFTAENGGSKSVDHILFTISESDVKHLAFIQAFTIVEKTGTPAEIEPVASSSHNAKFWKVSLSKPLGKGESVTVQVGTALTNTIHAFPAEIQQKDPQTVKWSGNAYFFTPYTSKQQVTKIKTGSGKVLSKHLGKNVNVNGEDVDVGPFADVAPFTTETLNLHYENNSPFATFVTGLKEIEISHWGNIAVEESYYLKHTGAKLKGSFSRYDYQRSNQGVSSFRQINALLPASATDIYYRDRIGNISTSHVRHSDEGVFVEILPRFPMFGGWSTDFYWGYNIPASEFISVDYDTGKYLLNISFGSPFLQTNIEQWEVRVIFPEGTSGIEWALPFEVDSTGESTRVTYFDTSSAGRPVLILKKNNVVLHHNAYLLVSYSFSNMSLLKEPFLLLLAFICFFVGTSVVQRLHLTISPPKPVITAPTRRTGRVGLLVTQVVDLDAALRNGYRYGNPSEANAEAFKNAIDALKKEASFTSVATAIENAHLRLRGLAKTLKKGKAKGGDAYESVNEELDALIQELTRK